MKITLVLALMSGTLLVGLFWTRDHVRAEDLLDGATVFSSMRKDALQRFTGV